MNQISKIRYRELVVFLLFLQPMLMASQTFDEQYELFKRNTSDAYYSFRQECNMRYVEFLRQSWEWYEGKMPFPKPEDLTPLPPRPYKKDNVIPKNIPVNVTPIRIIPQPRPIEPIRENTISDTEILPVDFCGVACNIRMPESAHLAIRTCHPDTIADGWKQLCSHEMDNTIRDCLETRLRYNLCDWAYLLFLDELSRKYCSCKNGATLLMAYLYCQSGYQMRLASDETSLFMLYGCQHQIFEKKIFCIGRIVLLSVYRTDWSYKNMQCLIRR